MMSDRQRRARLRLIRKLVEGPSEPDMAVLDTYQANDEDTLAIAEGTSQQAGAQWIAMKRGQIDSCPRLK
jgi:hypothetical protein